MIIRKMEYLLNAAEFEKEYYVSAVRGRDDVVSLKRKPQQSAAQRSRAAASSAVAEFKKIVALAKAEYSDPVKLQHYAEEFAAYQETRRRHQRDPFIYHNCRVPNLWAYVQCVVRERYLDARK